jgi:hypothetical protein
MKKVTSLLLLVGVAAFGLVACGDNVVPPEGGNVEGVTVTPSTLNIGVGGTGSLSADVDGDPDNSVSWSSNNQSVATVASDGTVTGVAEGNAVVTATSTVDNAHSASAEVNVTALENAEISINSIRAIDGSGNETALDPDDVSGRIRVSANVSEGDRTVEQVQILFNGEVAATQTFASGDLAEAEGIQMQGEVSVVTIDVNTAQVEGGLELDGTVHTGAFPNGDQTVVGRLVLANGTNVNAEHGETLTFNNDNVVHVSHMGDGNRAVSSNAPATEFWGGATVTFAATPVIYDGSGVGTVTITDAPADLTFADGATVSEPFLYPVEPDDNAAIEDAPGAGNGHDVSFGSATDDEGIALPLTQVASVTDMHLDFAAPTLSGTDEVFIDGQTVAAGNWYSAGAFSVDGPSDGGVGVPASASSEFVTVDVIDDATDTIPDVESVDGDLTEREIVYSGELVALADLLGNATDLSAATITTANDFGADYGEPTFSDVAPNDPAFIFNGDAATAANLVIWSSTDPDLADGTAGSQVVPANVTALVENLTAETDATATAGAEIDASGDPDYTLDVSGTGTALGDGAYQVTVSSPDAAVLDANVGEQVLEFILDTTDPETQMVNPPSSSVTSSNSSLTFTIEGNATDLNGLSEVLVTVRNADDNAVDTCELADGLVAVGTAAGEVNQNEVDVTENADGFDVNFTIQNNGGGEQDLCFFIESADNAQDNTGTADPNTSEQSARTVITWS